MEKWIKIKGFKCDKCDHEWIQRKKEKPKICPKCKSKFWDYKNQK